MAAMGQEFGAGLVEYRAIDPELHVGHVSYTQCKDLQATISNQDEDPATQLDAAWLGLELSLAMTHTPHPETGEHFSRKELAAAKQQAQNGFGAVLRNKDFPISIRAAAGLGLASVGMQHEMATRLPFHYSNKSALAYGSGVQKAAELLLSKDELTPEDDKLLYTMASIALMAEYAIQSSWFLPTPTRQPWDINVVNRKYSRLARITIGQEPLEGSMAMPPIALGDERWATDGTVVPHTTLRQYLTMEPGFLRVLTIMGRSKGNSDVFKGIAYDYLQFMNVEETRQESQKVEEVGPGSEADAKLRPDLSWYLKQSAEDFQALNPATLRINIINMQDSQTRGELKYYEQYVFGWMQLDYARTLTDQARAKRAEAERSRKQASQIARVNAPPLIQAAEAAEAEAISLMKTAAIHFDSAQVTFAAAAEAATKTQVGESFEMRMNAAATPVYKALFTEAAPEVTAAAVTAYKRDLTQLYEPLRSAHKKLQRNPDQRDAVDLAALMAGLSLLVLHSSDETGRDLILPASLRRSGKRGEMDLVTFPLIYMGDDDYDRYDTSRPVNIRLDAGTNIAHERGFVTIGWDRLAPHNDKVAFYARLVAAARANNDPEARKKRLRDEALDELTYEVTNAIADANS